MTPSEEPCISVIIPCHNAERFLRSSVTSAREQSDVLEIIVVDDGSTDGSGDTARELGVRLVEQAHQGASVARQTGTDLASGRFLQYLDADDWLELESLARRKQVLEAQGADVAYTDWQRMQTMVDGSMVPGPVVKGCIEDVDSDPEIALFTDFWAPPAAILYRREIVEKIGDWNTGLPVIQDARFFLDAALAGGCFVHVPGVGAYYRIDSEQSLSRRDGAAFVRDVMTNAEQVQEIWESRGKLSAAQRKALCQVLEYVARDCFGRDQDCFNTVMGRRKRLSPDFRWRYADIARTLQRVIGQDAARRVLDICVNARNSFQMRRAR